MGISNLNYLRRLIQLIFLFLFLYLFRKTEYSGFDDIPEYLNIIFRLDPLTAISTTLASRSIRILFAPAILVLIWTFLTGRTICGWICPLGTLLDIFHKLPFKKNLVRDSHSFRNFKLFLLIMVIISAVFGLQLSGLVDPLTILFQSMTFSIDPGFNTVTTSIFSMLYFEAPPWITDISEPLYSFLRFYILPLERSLFSVSLFFLLTLLIILATEAISQRFWCRNICPLGALLSVIAAFSILKRTTHGSCASCDICVNRCKMQAYSPEGHFRESECIRCLNCISHCPKNKVHFSGFLVSADKISIDFSRRAFMMSTTLGVSLPFFRYFGYPNARNPFILRPPGVIDEADFLTKCIRCGECMKICIENALHPALLDGGLAGIFSPLLIPRRGYCEQNCTLCGQICPAGAIPNLALKDKVRFVIGEAVIDVKRCIPFADARPCLVCEEHCPVHDKAIKLLNIVVRGKDQTQIELKAPFVNPKLCNGCGICEYKCPIKGVSAIRVIRQEK